MSTAYIYNSYDRGGVILKYAGVSFYFPYGETVAIPDWTFREVDENQSAGGALTGAAPLVYKDVLVNGMRVAQELTMKGDFMWQERGVIIVEGTSTGKRIFVHAGTTSYAAPEVVQPCPIDGSPCWKLHVDIAERKATKAEMAAAEAKAFSYKTQMINAYFQSKRERMTGGRGHLMPDTLTRAFMEELGVEDIDDVATHKRPAAIDPELIATAIAAATEAAIKSGAEAMAERIYQRPRLLKRKRSVLNDRRGDAGAVAVKDEKEG